MSAENMTLSKLHQAYENWLGTPAHIIQLRRDEFSEQIPTELDILFFHSSENENLSDDDFFTYIATAGMSRYAMQEPDAYAELIIGVKGHHHSDDLEALGRKIGELAVIPFRYGINFAPNRLISSLSLPIFVQMTCMLVTNWFIKQPIWLPNLESAVLMLTLCPVYQSEAQIIQQIGDMEAYERFVHEGIDLQDPTRIPARLEAIASPLEQEGTKATNEK